MGNIGVVRGFSAVTHLPRAFLTTHTRRRLASRRPPGPLLNDDGRCLPKPRRPCAPNATPTAISDLLTQHGVDVEKVRRRCPAPLRYDVMRVEALLRFLSERHFDPAKTLNKYPQVLQMEPKVLASNLIFLQTLRIDLKKAVESCPMLLYLPTKTVQSKMAMWAQLGLNPETVLKRWPAMLTLSDDAIRRQVAFLQGLGLNAKRIVQRHPQVIGRSIEGTLRPTFDFITKDMGRSLEKIDRNPVSLLYSLENRIKPRYRYMMEHGIRKDYSLSTLLTCSDECFTWTIARQPVQHYHDWLKSHC
jgi:hypothetical protein